MDDFPHYFALIISLLISIPSGVYMFRECFDDYSQFKKELKQVHGSEALKLFMGEFTKAVNHQFIEFKVGIAIAFPLLIFIITNVTIRSLLESLINLFQGW